MEFKILKKDTLTKARCGELITPHGNVPTPIFMPVATTGTVKAVHQRELETEAGAHIILANTYHLYLRPGTGIIEKAGGLHRFINWKRPMLTDSGGYQVYSLANRRKISEEGVMFRSHIDGSTHFFTPELVIDIQRSIGADIAMAFDECTPWPCEHEYARKSMERTHRWLQRCCNRFGETTARYDYTQALFPIVQGSTYKDLRVQSAEFVGSLGCEGNAIGGLSVGEPTDELYEMTGLVCGILPENKPRYLMGVGTPANILESIALGVDMFDCVIPTRNGRNGQLFTRNGIIHIKNAKWKDDLSPLDTDGTTFVDNYYSKAYLRHLFHGEEFLALQISAVHNLGFYLWLVSEARRQISQGNFAEWKAEMAKKVDERL